MTFVLGWCEDAGAFLCADSAATHGRPPVLLLTSFGEQQQLDHATVEERAVKILQLHDRVLVAVCGDALAGLDFAMSVRIRMLGCDAPLRTILAQVQTEDDRRRDFTLLFAHDVDGRPALTTFHSDDRSVEDVGRDRYATFGSMPNSKKNLAGRLATVVRQHGLPPDAQLTGVLVALQAVGMTEYLPQHGVGGAFFGAYLSARGVVWQGDINYVTYQPGLFRDAPFIRPGEKTPPGNGAVEKIRVLVREGAGILLSSLTGLPGRVLVPPTSRHSEEDWKRIVLDAIPPPFRVLVPSVNFGLLSVASPKAVYIYNPDLVDDGFFTITEVGKQMHMGAVTELVDSLEMPTPQGAFDLTIVTDQDRFLKTYRIAIPNE